MERFSNFINKLMRKYALDEFDINTGGSSTEPSPLSPLAVTETTCGPNDVRTQANPPTANLTSIFASMQSSAQLFIDKIKVISNLTGTMTDQNETTRVPALYRNIKAAYSAALGFEKSLDSNKKNFKFMGSNVRNLVKSVIQSISDCQCFSKIKEIISKDYASTEDLNKPIDYIRSEFVNHIKFLSETDQDRM